LIGSAVALLFAPAIAGSCLAAGADTPAVTTPPESTNVPIQSYGENDPKCSEWTDGCVVCTKGGCSNIGIACQPKAISCRDTPSKPDK
jgi:hypothetical protein